MTTIVSLLTKNGAVVGSDLRSVVETTNVWGIPVADNKLEVIGFKKLFLSKNKKLIIGRGGCLRRSYSLCIDDVIDSYLSQSVKKVVKGLPRSVWTYLDRAYCSRGFLDKFGFGMLITYCYRDEFKIKHFEPELDESGNSLKRTYSMENYSDYKAIGMGEWLAWDVLWKEYEPKLSLKDGIEIVEKAINRACKRKYAGSKGLNVYTLTRKGIREVIYRTE